MPRGAPLTSSHCFANTGGSLLFKAPRHVDIHNEPLRYCLVARNTTGIKFRVQKHRWPTGEDMLYHGDVLVGNGMTMVVECALAPWRMPRLPPFQPPPVPPAPPPAPAPTTAPQREQTHLERMLGVQVWHGKHDDGHWCPDVLVDYWHVISYAPQQAHQP